MSNIMHSSRTDCCGTPKSVLNLVHEVLGQIDLDPASDWRFNINVQATHHITEKENGLVKPWPTGCTVFLNPPGGKVGRKSKTALFWQRLIEYRQSGSLNHAIFLAFSLEALQVTQSCDLSIGDFPFCVPSSRMRFESPEGVPGDAPTHSNAIVYVPGIIDNTVMFRRAFSKLGKVIGA